MGQRPQVGGNEPVFGVERCARCRSFAGAVSAGNNVVVVGSKVEVDVGLSWATRCRCNVGEEAGHVFV
jgi:hypothetical protein